jgi:superfamily II DNA or RNA helicase
MRGGLMDCYAKFLEQKVTTAPPSGFDPVLPMPAATKPFQVDIITWACRRGRAAIFAGTGLGKTLMELTWAANVAAYTGGQVLIFTPLAVAEQTVQEAVKFGIDGVSYAADDSAMTTAITITNYDRRDKFDLSQFAGIVLDESGIIKDHDSRTRIELTEACRETPYLLCGSATPAPNDWTELGQHAEFLDVMSAKEMLAMFFVHDGAVRANAEDDWRLKGHAQDDFWRWVSSWSVMIRHPRDLGYEDAGYDLPPLHMHQITVRSETQALDGMLFAMEANTLQERISARKNTIVERVQSAADIVATAPDEPWLIWCNLNAEADAIVKAISGAVNVQGSDKPETKTRHLLGFVRGEPRILVSKQSIAGRGMNWQHANRMIFVGLNDSFEQLFQAVRRCWRFGQTRDVHCYLIASDLEGAVVANLQAKERKYDQMAAAMADHMKDLCIAHLRGGRQQISTYEANQTMRLPTWL